ncbi:hypothetical protein [Brevibacillus choshinensis]|uniref:hypothetical protein n=1 Tax=Brevibacillus choshinensis TaxID=54911 RepID=UPI002E212658|nr:hypothetical protein [Brevibacillus choshinensis]
MSTVLKDFICKVTRRLWHTGEEYEGNRLEELQQLGYVDAADSKDTDDRESPVWPKHIGGGRYELSNGEKIKGKDVAIAAQAELDELLDD